VQPGPSNADILVVDDLPVNVHILSHMLQARGYRVRTAPSGELALQAAASQPPDLILLDIMMPDMDGYEVCRRLKADRVMAEIPVVFISALTEPEDRVKAFAAGGVDYVAKPFNAEEVNARVQAHVRLRWAMRQLEERNTDLESIVRTQVKEISDSQMATIYALAKLAESRDDDTGRHIERVQEFCVILARGLAGTPRDGDRITGAYMDNLFRASPLHDIGKVGIPDAVLLKPGRLTPEEFEIMKGHTLLGARTLEAVRDRYPQNAFVGMGISVARSHHERWDGSGYPDGLAGTAIPLSARIISMADVYDALRSRRPYKEPFTHEKSRDIILEGVGKHFDPEVGKVFAAREDELRKTREAMKD
jgi:putative two-component system response regulator